MVKDLPAGAEFTSLGREDPGESGNPFSILAWEIQGTKDPEGYSPWGHKSGSQLSTQARRRWLKN